MRAIINSPTGYLCTLSDGVIKSFPAGAIVEGDAAEIAVRAGAATELAAPALESKITPPPEVQAAPFIRSKRGRRK